VNLAFLEGDQPVQIPGRSSVAGATFPARGHAISLNTSLWQSNVMVRQFRISTATAPV
jgi:hypothetical protein